MRHLPQDIVAAIRTAKWQGLSLTDLEAEFNIARGTAQRHTTDIPVKAKAGRRVQHDHAKVLHLLKQGLSQTLISERLGISRMQVYRICKRTFGVVPSKLPAHLASLEWRAAA